MRHLRVNMLLLAALTAVLMSLPFLVQGTSLLALTGLVPLLCMERIASNAGVKRLWPWYLGTFAAWNSLTVWWICNATFWGGVFAIVANALQMSLVFGLFRASKKTFGGMLPYVFLALLWTAWERWYFSAEISFPWLTLGHAFARSPWLVQWYSITGTLGGSLWVWACNLSIFGLVCAKADGSMGRWTKWAKRYCAAILALLFPGLITLSLVKYYTFEDAPERMDVLITQPNIDPYSKFHLLSQEQQDAIAERQMRPVLQGRDSASGTLLILTPETFTRYIDTDDITAHPTARRFRSLILGKPGVNLLLGNASKTYRHSEEAPNILCYPAGPGLWYNTHNSAALLSWDGDADIYHKSKLVVGTELTPYPGFFVPLDEKFFGGAMARDTGQEEVSLLNVKTPEGGSIPLGCAICYESVYGEFCTDYIRKGARAMVIITNDAWWGDTPGYRQHLSYASLRAIELGRDIARCGNTGISAFINSRGDIVKAGPWWEACSLEGSVALRDGETFFVRYGDICGRICTMLAVLLFLALAVRKII